MRVSARIAAYCVNADLTGRNSLATTSMNACADAWARARVVMGQLLRFGLSEDHRAIVILRAPDPMTDATHLGIEPRLLDVHKGRAEPREHKPDRREYFCGDVDDRVSRRIGENESRHRTSSFDFIEGL